MDRSDIIYLISDKKHQDEIGQWISEEQIRPVFCSVQSITRQEWFDAARRAEWSEYGLQGFKPQYRFDIFVHDYDGEEVVEYNGKRYGVYRTFLAKGDTLELYVEAKRGNTKQHGN